MEGVYKSKLVSGSNGLYLDRDVGVPYHDRRRAETCGTDIVHGGQPVVCQVSSATLIFRRKDDDEFSKWVATLFGAESA